MNQIFFDAVRSNTAKIGLHTFIKLWTSKFAGHREPNHPIFFIKTPILETFGQIKAYAVFC